MGHKRAKPEISDKEMAAFQKFAEREAKKAFGVTEEGTCPVDVFLNNRKRHQSFTFFPLKYLHHYGKLSAQEVRNDLLSARMALRLAQLDLDRRLDELEQQCYIPLVDE